MCTDKDETLEKKGRTIFFEGMETNLRNSSAIQGSKVEGQRVINKGDTDKRAREEKGTGGRKGCREGCRRGGGQGMCKEVTKGGVPPQGIDTAQPVLSCCERNPFIIWVCVFFVRKESAMRDELRKH